MVNSYADSNTEEIRHALLITEYKKGTIGNEVYPTPPPDSKIISKYILCAENEDERNDWISYMEAHITKLRTHASPDVIHSIGLLSKGMNSEESLFAPQASRIPSVRTINEAFDSTVNGSTEDMRGPKVLPMPPHSLSRLATYKSQASTSEAPSSMIADKRSSFGHKSQTVGSTGKKVVEDTERLMSKQAAPTFIIPREKSIKVVTKGDKNPMRAALGVFKRKHGLITNYS